MGTKGHPVDPSKGHRPRTGHARPRQAHGVHRALEKPAEALVCERCGVFHHAGRWRWGSPPLADLASTLCPACVRIRDRRPAGTVRLHADLAPHEEEIRRMISHAEQAESEEHPLERVMGVEQSEDGLLVTTTGAHLARRIADALKRRFHRKGSTSYPESEAVVLVDLEE